MDKFFDLLVPTASGSLIVPTVSLVAASIAAFIAVVGLRIGAAVNLRNKRVDVISGCNQRYDALAQTKTAIIRSITSLNSLHPKERRKRADERRSIRQEIDLYHRRFWGLKSDQIDYWLAGYVDPETLISWFMSTIETIQNPVELWRDFDETAYGGWKAVMNFHRTTNPRLFQVVKSIAHPRFRNMHPNMRYAHLFKLFQSIESEERPLIAMLTRNNHRRLSMQRFKAKLPREISRYVIEQEIRVLRSSLRRICMESKLISSED